MQTIFSKKSRGVNRWLRKTRDVHGDVGFAIYSLLTFFFFTYKSFTKESFTMRL